LRVYEEAVAKCSWCCGRHLIGFAASGARRWCRPLAPLVTEALLARAGAIALAQLALAAAVALAVLDEDREAQPRGSARDAAMGIAIDRVDLRHRFG
jgi:hypothetical protein